MSTTIPEKISKNTLKELFDNHANLYKNRMANKAINDIKYGVLQENNLNKKIYHYRYILRSDESSLNDDYFSNILDKLLYVFENMIIKYTINHSQVTCLLTHPELTDRDNIPESISNSYSNFEFNSSYDLLPNKTTVDENGIIIIENIITIDWS